MSMGHPLSWRKPRRNIESALAKKHLCFSNRLLTPSRERHPTFSAPKQCCLKSLRWPDSRESFQDSRNELLLAHCNLACSNVMKIEVSLRMDSREAPRFALRIAGPSKVRDAETTISICSGPSTSENCKIWQKSGFSQFWLHCFLCGWACRGCVHNCCRACMCAVLS